MRASFCASVIAAFSLALTLTACSKVTAENYAHIATGESRADVVKLLGEPNKSESGSLLGISGESAIWESGKTVITLRFVNDLVIAKDFKQQ